MYIHIYSQILPLAVESDVLAAVFGVSLLEVEERVRKKTKQKSSKYLHVSQNSLSVALIYIRFYHVMTFLVGARVS